MIKVFDKLWYAIKNGDKDNLAYMTYYEDNKAFEKRKSTGLEWAGGGYYDHTKKVHVQPDVAKVATIDNTPTEGFYIGDSVSRWSTSNKLFRVQDPRGFTVEVPTGNISTLLHLTTVEKGVVKEECVWGRDGSNHVLLPVNSKPYLEATKNMSLLKAPAIKIKDLKMGSKVRFLKDSEVYNFIGKGKVTTLVKPFDYSVNYRYGGSREKVYLEGQEYEYTHKGYINIFSYQPDWSSTPRYIKRGNPTILEIVEEGSGEIFKGGVDIVEYPTRSVVEGTGFYSYDLEFVSIEWKE